MLVIVTKDKHTHDCTTQKQLDRFLAAGWKKARKQNTAAENSGDNAPDTPAENELPVEGEQSETEENE